MFLEHRNETKTALELRALIAEIDKVNLVVIIIVGWLHHLSLLSLLTPFTSCPPYFFFTLGQKSQIEFP
jgi:hypothetical protein